MEPLIVVPIGVAIALVWVYQFIQLMLLSDADFPGSRDKMLWVAAFLLAFPVAPFAFLWWKSAYRTMLWGGRRKDDDRR